MSHLEIRAIFRPKTGFPEVLARGSHQATQKEDIGRTLEQDE